MPRVIKFGLPLLTAAVLLLIGWRCRTSIELSPRPVMSPPQALPSSIVASPPPAATPSPEDEPPFEGIEWLHAPDRTAVQDLQLLQEVFASWQTNFPREGNPVGSNAEITASLTGENRLRHALIPRRHPAINAEGELCDRWGTPYFFHQLSGTEMEIRSAGPDRRHYNEDDVVLTP